MVTQTPATPFVDELEVFRREETAQQWFFFSEDRYTRFWVMQGPAGQARGGTALPSRDGP